MATEIISSYINKSQVPFDAKLYAKTLAELIDLGEGENKAYTYYEDMEVICVENHTTYVWREYINNESGGLIPNGVTYPVGVVANGINYAGRKFNFFPKKITINDLSDFPDLSLKADKANVLEKNNTVPFNPTQNYHPTTLKFVVDLLNNLSNSLPNTVKSVTANDNNITITLIDNVVQNLENFAKLNLVQEYTKQQVVTTVELPWAGVINWDLNNAQNAYLLLTSSGAELRVNPLQMIDGGVYTIAIKQDATGSRTITFHGGNYVFPFGVGTPTLTTTGNRTDIFTFVSDGNKLFCTNISNDFVSYKE